MNTTKNKKKQQWQVLYHHDCVGGVKSGGIPCDIVHAHPDHFDQLNEAQEFMRKNPEPPRAAECNGDYVGPGRPIGEAAPPPRPMLLSAVQVRGPVRCSMQPRLEKV